VPVTKPKQNHKKRNDAGLMAISNEKIQENDKREDHGQCDLYRTKNSRVMNVFDIEGIERQDGKETKEKRV
jgi:hypothetical protein